MRLIKIMLILVGLACPSLPSKAGAICREGNGLNPQNDICWDCIYPIKIGSMEIMSGELPDAPDCPCKRLQCECKYGKFKRRGISICFWEPARFVEAVKDPYCFPGLGYKMDNNSTADLSGTNYGQANQENMSTFAQAHWFVFSAWAIMGMLEDSICVEQSDVDLAYITEVDALWNDDELAMLINPEAMLFANMIAQLSCIVDSVSANVWLPLAPLFWCMGSWGSAYPLTGHNNDDDIVQAHAGIGARMIFKLGREQLLYDPGINLCYKVPTPIWIKWHYRMQIAKPVRARSCIPIGRSGLLWAYGKNPVLGTSNGSDNFVFMIFRKRACCAS